MGPGELGFSPSWVNSPLCALGSIPVFLGPQFPHLQKDKHSHMAIDPHRHFSGAGAVGEGGGLWGEDLTGSGEA